jgi:hypothetical protein
MPNNLAELSPKRRPKSDVTPMWRRQNFVAKYAEKEIEESGAPGESRTPDLLVRSKFQPSEANLLGARVAI